MTVLNNGMHVFVRDCVCFLHPDVGIAKGSQCFIPNGIDIIFDSVVVPVSSIFAFSEKPAELIRWIATTSSFARFDTQETKDYLMQYHLKTKAAGQKVVMLPLVLFSDDTSGNNNMSKLIAQQLTLLETEGVVVYDAYYEENVLVIAQLLCVICDNPRASQLLKHLGGAANKYCRFCTVDQRDTPHLIGEESTISKTLQCIEMIQLQPTEAGKAAMSKEIGLRDVPNFLLHIPADLFKYLFSSHSSIHIYCIFNRSIPVEVLHTILLGLCKYFLKEVMPRLSKAQKKELLAWICAFNLSGFQDKVHGNVCNHFKSFVGRDFKAWAQMAILILSPYLSSEECEVLLSCMKVFRIAYCCHFKLCESFNGSVRMQNIYGNKQAPSRDIANHFACIEYLRFICEGGVFNAGERCGSGLQELYKSMQVQQFLNFFPMKELNEVLENGTPKLSRYGCLLFTLSRTIFLVDSSIILTAVSFVHECTNTCSFVEATVCQAQEREDVEGIELVFRHVWNNLEFSFNTASASKVGQN
eukprot:Em0007g1197a